MLLSVALAAALTSTTPALAQAPGFENFGGTPQPGGPPPASDQPHRMGGDRPPMVQPGGRGAGTLGGQSMPGGAGGSQRPPNAKKPPRVIKRCARRGGLRVCRHYVRRRLIKITYHRGRRLVKVALYRRGRLVKVTYHRGGRPFKVCAKVKGGKLRCRAPKRRSASGATEPGPPARIAARLNSGYTNPVLPAVVRFYLNNDGWCSGTLVLRGIVLTAAHCLFANRTDGRGQYGYYPPSAMLVTPGNYVGGDGMGVAPYGNWQVVNSWVPQGWTNEDGGLDWGIVQLAPDANGNYPGDFTGTHAAYWGANIPVGTRFWNAGYPYSGPFRTAAWYFGHGQYFCDTVWNPPYSANDWSYTNSSFNIVIDPCEMNGGSSGGPVFVQFGDGSWGIVGVNNRGVNRQDGFGAYGITFYFDQRFGSFWQSVIGAINSGRASRTGARAWAAGSSAGARSSTTAGTR